jgi:hypothetical protein
MVFEVTGIFLFRKPPVTRILDKNPILVLIFYFILKKKFFVDAFSSHCLKHSY